MHGATIRILNIKIQNKHIRLEAYMELAMTIHRYTTVSTDSKKNM
jgi:hypothetical protein